MAEIPSELGRIGQIGMVVRDLDQAMKYYWEVQGIGPWRGYEVGPEMLKGMVYRGRPGSYRTRIAIANAGPVDLELIQYIEGDSIHRDSLERSGEGVNHLGVFVQNLEAPLAAMEQRGYRPIQSASGFGKHGDGGYVYLGTEDSAGTVIELIKVASEPKEPDFVYPEG